MLKNLGNYETYFFKLRFSLGYNLLFFLNKNFKTLQLNITSSCSFLRFFVASSKSMKLVLAEGITEEDGTVEIPGFVGGGRAIDFLRILAEPVLQEPVTLAELMSIEAEASADKP
jgi:hypothetical protein